MLFTMHRLADTWRFRQTPRMETREDLNRFTQSFIERTWLTGRNMPIVDVSEDEKLEMAVLVQVMLEKIIADSGSQTKWSDVVFYQPNAILVLSEAKALKMNAEVRLQLHQGSVVMTYELPFFEEIPSMDDAFWAGLSTAVSKHGMTYFCDNHEAFSAHPANRKLERFKKSAVFSLMQNFIYSYQHDIDHQREPGRFELSIPFEEMGWFPIVDRLTAAFSDFYRLSQQLYRSYYLKNSQRWDRMLYGSSLDTVNAIALWIRDRQEPWNLKHAESQFPEATPNELRFAHHLMFTRGFAVVTSQWRGKPSAFAKTSDEQSA